MIEPHPSYRPLHSMLVVRLAAIVLLVLTTLVTWQQGAAGQTEDAETESSGAMVAPEPRVTAADATGARVAVELIGLSASAASAPLTLSVEGTDVGDARLTPASQYPGRAEVLLVVDVHVRGTTGDLVSQVAADLTAMAESLPEGTRVGVVAAGEGAIVSLRPTADTARVREALADLPLRQGAALLSAVDRAPGLFSDDPTVAKTVVVVANGTDQGSAATAAEARVGLLQNGVQLIAVNYAGGEPALADMANRTGGLVYNPEDPSQLQAVLAAVGEHAGGRSVVTFTPPEGVDARTTVNISLGERTFALSYPDGLRTVNPLQLTPEASTEPGGFGFFQTSIGLYLALMLAFAGISLGVWSIGSTLANRDENVAGAIARYAEQPDGEIDDAVVQSAIVQRAVDFSESFAEQQGFRVRVEEILEKADLPIRVGEALFLVASGMLIAASLGLLLTNSILAGVLFAFLVVPLAFFFVRFRAARRLKKFEAQLPDTLQLLSGTLRAGYSLPQGLEAVSNEISDPMGEELRRAMTEARLGRELEDSLEGVADRMSSPDFAWTVMAIGIQREVGGNLNELLSNVSDTMVARDRLKREVAALTAEGKMSAGVLSFLPPGLGLVMWFINPEYVSLLFTDIRGNILLGLGVLSATIGLAWMKKVITIDV
ncbi:MAG: type II secretion system F family protein [Actinomycetota bacterium]